MISISPARRPCRAAAILLFALLPRPSAEAELIPPARLVDWTAGVRTGVIGGIPTNRTRLRNVTQAPYNADNTGATDARAAIQAAIDAAAAGDVVYLPAGTYRIEGGLTLGANFSGKTLRGAGPGSTILDQRCNVGLVVGSSSGLGLPNPPVLVTGGLAKGGTTVSINGIPQPYTSNFEVGNILVFLVENNSSLPVASVYNFDVHTNQAPTNQAVRLVSKTSNSLTFFPPLLDSYGGGDLQVRVAYAEFRGSGIGLEDLTIDASNYTAGGGAYSCVQLENCFGSWVRNCVIRKAAHYPLSVSRSLNCEVRHSRIEGSSNTGSNGAGLLFNGYSCLIEDNIILDAFPIIEVNAGASGNVFAYNYGPPDGMWDTNHAPHNQFNLYEGNAGGFQISDGYFGGEANLTIFRNFFHGTLGINLRRWTRNTSAVGNMLPRAVDDSGFPNMGNTAFNGTASLIGETPWRNWNLTGTITTRADDDHCTIRLDGAVNDFAGLGPGVLVRFVLHWGGTHENQAAGDATLPITTNVVTLTRAGGAVFPSTTTTVTVGPGSYGYQERDLDVAATTLKKGNRYLNNNSFDSLGGDTLPPSLFRTAKPSWFKDLVWPPYDPVTPRAPNIEHIPAGYRFVHGVDPPGNAPQGPSNLTAPGVPGPGDRPQGVSPASKAEGSAKPQTSAAKKAGETEAASVAATPSPSPTPKAEKPKRKTVRKKAGGN